MVIKEFRNFTEKFGYLTAGVTTVESGISSKTGKPFNGFSYIKILEYGATDSTQIFIAENAVKSIEKATADMPYLSGVSVAGSIDSSGRFTAESISTFNFDLA